MKLVNRSYFNEIRFQLRIYKFFWRKQNMRVRMINAIQFHDNMIKKQWEYYFIYTIQKKRTKANQNIWVSFWI